MNCQPPTKIMIVNTDIRIIEQYSARKNKAKPILEYSTLKPETSSDSASGRSKGALLVSANILTTNIRNNGKNGIKKNIHSWYSTMLIKFNEPTQKISMSNIKPMTTSYEII